MERIYLRAGVLDLPSGAQPVIVLPDGRIILASTTFSSEAAIRKLNPGAVLRYMPDADATINHVMDEDAANHP